VFVVLAEGTRRTTRRGWVVTWDDNAQVALVEFGAAAVRVARGDAVDDEPFEDDRHVERKTRGRPNQQRFKVQVIQRYGGACALCPVSALELISAAHLVPVSDKGSSDPRNGLALCGNHHAALDRSLVSIEPESRAIFIAKGHDAAGLNVTRADLNHLASQPARDALQYRWDMRVGDDWVSASADNEARARAAAAGARSRRDL
jgi:putative restriction endonuclease